MIWRAEISRRAALACIAWCASASLGQTPAECIAAFRQSYASAWGPSTSDVREWSLIAADDGAGLARYRALPGITESVHPATLTPMFDKRLLRVTADGRGGLHVQVQADRSAGPNREAARVITVWGDDGWARPGGNQPGLEANLVPTPKRTCEEWIASHEKGETPFARVRSEKSFVEMVRWVAETFECAPEMREVRRGGTAVELEAVGLGMFVTLDAATGELARVRTVAPSGVEGEWWWEGSLQGAALPARHPHFQFMKQTSNGAPNEADRTRYDGPVEFTSFTRETRVDPSLFRWTQIADRAWDRTRGVVVRPDGSVDEERTAVRTGRLRPQPLSRSDVQPTGESPLRRRGSPWVVWIGACLAAVAASGTFLWRRHTRRA